MNAKSIGHLCTVDSVLGSHIARIGPCQLKPDKRRSPFQALVQAVAHQQLNGKAANTILQRFVALYPHGNFPTPEEVDRTHLRRITGAGLSRAKAAYIKEIARSALSGLVPSRNKIEDLTDDEIIARLTQIKGVGRWTVEMVLIFSLGRPDVLPAHDFGIRNGFAVIYRKRKLPTPNQVLDHGRRWSPHRTTAAWYLWRAVDLRKSQAPAPLW